MWRRVARFVGVVAVGASGVTASGHLGAGVVWAQVDTARNGVTTRELVIEPPTLINLGFEWFIHGDDNRNATVEVSFPAAGATRSGPPGSHCSACTVSVSWPARSSTSWARTCSRGAFSIWSPTPRTRSGWSCVILDGVTGEPTKTVTVRTRAEPVPHEEGRVLHVYPHGFDGPKQEPSFEGLMCAYNYNCSGSDRATTGRPRVRPRVPLCWCTLASTATTATSTTVGDRWPIERCRSKATYYLTADGTPDQPIAIKAAGDGEVIFDGDGNFALFNVMAADYTYFEGVTFRNTEIAIWAGEQFVAGSKGLTVKRCRFEDVGAGVFTNYSGSSGFYIADRLVLWT